jgi:hypothetical protein
VSTLNAPLPQHFYCLVRTEYLRNLESGHGETEEACVFGIASEPNRALGFHVHLKSGAVFWRLPISALCWKPDAPPRPTALLQWWDCFDWSVTVTAFPYLRERECRIRLKDGSEESGMYVLTVDWYANGYSDQPDQNKCAHLIKLDDGCFGLAPNNFLLWRDLSFTVKEPTFRGLGYRANKQVWWAEEDLEAPTAGLREAWERITESEAA